ncbi:MAG: type II toxin-antitoxin system VapC family toxin [Chloroflexota bacterium]
MSAGKAAYVDSSALIKLAIHEPESAALGRYLRGHPTRLSSALARVEVARAVAHIDGNDAAKRARAVLARIELIGVTTRVLEAAAGVAPQELRTLDAIHLATAILVMPDLGSFVTYDARLATAAAARGFKVVQPG